MERMGALYQVPATPDSSSGLGYMVLSHETGVRFSYPVLVGSTKSAVSGEDATYSGDSPAKARLPLLLREFFGQQRAANKRAVSFLLPH